MSKKMMKRSLALGALMAFVITGSAMAAEYGDINSGASIVGDNNVTLSKADVTWVGGANFVKQSTITVTEGHKLTIEANADTQGKGLFLASTIEGNGYVVMHNKAKGYAISAGISGLANISSISANQIDIIADDGKAVYLTTNGDNLTLSAKTINVLGSGKSGGTDGLYAATNAQLKVSGFDELNISVKNLTNDSTEGGRGVVANNAADVIISGAEGAVANIYSEGRSAVGALDGKSPQYGDSVLKINVDTLNISGKPIEDGEVRKNAVVSAQKDIVNDMQAIVDIDVDNLSIKNLSEVEGTYAIGAQGNGAKVDITVTGTAEIVGGIITTNGGTSTLNLGENFTWDASNTGENTVTELNGAGTIIMASDDDKVTVGFGDATLSVQADGALAEAIASESDQASALQSLADKVEGVEVTQVGTAEGEVAGAITADVKYGAVVAGSVKEAVNTVNKSIGEASVVGMAHIRAHMNDMNKRMGELRMANGEAGIWTRMVRGEEEFAGAKSQYNQYQLGYDEKLSVDKRWTVGAAVTFAEGNGNFANGSTENDSTAFAIYGSKLNNDGTFVDLIARYARFESDITVADAKSDYSTNGMSVSAEFGKRIQQGKGFWIEPQVELTYGSVDSAEYTINGKDVTVGDMDSLIGRVGFSLGKDIKQGNVYARASYLYDFDGETDTTFGKNGVTRTIEEDLGGGWWEVGVGANVSLSKATYIYADIEKTFGGEIDTNWQWNLGVRYSF
ncbi:MAG: autotransporter outer membrane beta-barrel domain-containing protein [Phascolarctobacterium sp.]|nr:autotransporter outer membrane beta-barrel domain-containing protein [Phascolarctobacterium sp.]